MFFVHVVGKYEQIVKIPQTTNFGRLFLGGFSNRTLADLGLKMEKFTSLQYINIWHFI
jgi:hypothetical protein